jgi:hypothetical protein
MELSPSWEAANCAATRELRSILWNPKVYYRVHKSPPLISILSQIDPIHTIPSYLFKIHFNIVHSFTSWSSKWYLSFWLSHQHPICIPLLPHLCYMPCTSHPPWDSKPSGEKILELFDVNEFEISTPQCPLQNSSAGNSDVLGIVVHQNSRLSRVIVSDILDSDRLPTAFHVLDHVKARNLSEPIKKFAHWEGFQSFISDLIQSTTKAKLRGL